MWAGPEAGAWALEGGGWVGGYKNPGAGGWAGGRGSETPDSDSITGLGSLEPSSPGPVAFHEAKLGQRTRAGDGLWGRWGLRGGFAPGGADGRERPLAGCARPRAGEEALRTRRGGPEGRSGLMPHAHFHPPPTEQPIVVWCGAVRGCEARCGAVRCGWKRRRAWGQAGSSLQESRDWRTAGLAPQRVARVLLRSLCHQPRGPRRQAGWLAGRHSGACVGEAPHPLGLGRVEKALEAPSGRCSPLRP